VKISKTDVKHVAELARLSLEEADLEMLTEEIGKILEYIDKLNELNVTDTPPTFHVLDLSTPLRDDVVQEWLTQEEALANAPGSEGDFFTVPKFIED